MRRWSDPRGAASNDEAAPEWPGRNPLQSGVALGLKSSGFGLKRTKRLSHHLKTGIINCFWMLSDSVDYFNLRFFLCLWPSSGFKDDKTLTSDVQLICSGITIGTLNKPIQGQMFWLHGCGSNPRYLYRCYFRDDYFSIHFVWWQGHPTVLVFLKGWHWEFKGVAGVLDPQPNDPRFGRVLGLVPLSWSRFIQRSPSPTSEQRPGGLLARTADAENCCKINIWSRQKHWVRPRRLFYQTCSCLCESSDF